MSEECKCKKECKCDYYKKWLAIIQQIAFEQGNPRIAVVVDYALAERNPAEYKK